MTQRGVPKGGKDRSRRCQTGALRGMTHLVRKNKRWSQACWTRMLRRQLLPPQSCGLPIFRTARPGSAIGISTSSGSEVAPPHSHARRMETNALVCIIAPPPPAMTMMMMMMMMMTEKEPGRSRRSPRLRIPATGLMVGRRAFSMMTTTMMMAMTTVAVAVACTQIVCWALACADAGGERPRTPTFGVLGVSGVQKGTAPWTTPRSAIWSRVS